MSKLSNTKITVLNQFEARVDEWTFGDFEQVLEQAMGSEYGNYQTAKMVIVEADSEGRWPETVRRYTSTISRLFGLCCINQPQVELPQSPDGFIPYGPFAACPGL